jgi:hypothetical protein
MADVDTPWRALCAVEFTVCWYTTPDWTTGDQGLPMKNFVAATLLVLWMTGSLPADQDPSLELPSSADLFAHF